MKLMKVLGVLVLTAIFATGLASAADTIKIGLMTPLTGIGAPDGASVYHSVELAVERVNKEGGLLGKKVELVVYDDRLDTKEAVALARKLIEKDQVVGYVGGSYSMPTRASAPIFQEAGIPFVAAYAVHPDVTKAGDFCFRNGFLGKVEGKSTGYVAVEMLKAKKIALMTTDNDFGREMAAGFRDYIKKKGKGSKIVFEQTYPFKEKDYKPYLSKIKNAGADLIVVSGYYFHTAPILKQAREMGIDTQVLGEEGADSPKTIEIAGKSAEGFIMVTNLNRDDPRPEVQEFLNEYEKRYKKMPDMVGASAYDAFMIICEGIKRSGSLKGPAIRDAIANIKDYNALTGLIKNFTDIGEVVKEVQVQIVKNGRFRYYGVVTDSDLITP
jgi:branched-chain amino acid transport system substrate-binding protein